MARSYWTQSALTDLEKLDTLIARRIVKKSTWLVKNFENITPEPLIKELKGLFKFRIGDWRIVYSLEEDDTIVIQYIGHRSQIYKRINH